MTPFNENRSRRQFLRNAALTTISLALLPDLATARRSGEHTNTVACNPTTLDYYGQGPFYLANAPVISNNQLASPSEPGTRLILSGVVKTLDCTAVIPDTELDIWHADNSGAYDNSGYKLRGKTTTTAQGFYLFETIMPGKYLNGSKYRPSHIHFRITPPGRPTLVTQLYFQGDSEIPGDAAASIASGTYDATGRIIPVTLNGQGKYEGTWDIAIDGNGTVGAADLHLDKGILYSATPNPFTDLVEISYGIFRESRAGIQVFDLRGTLVATLDELTLSPQKYSATWKPHPDLPPGTYFLALRVNDLQVHYLKIVKT